MFIVLAFGIAFAAWGLRRRGTWSLAGITVAGLLVMVVGTAAGTSGYPWSNLVVLVVSVTLGVVIGRLVPPTGRAMFATLAVVAALDASQLLFAGGAGGSVQPWEAWFHLLVVGSDGTVSMKIGALDLVLVAAISEHWRRRGAGFWLATLTGPLGLVLSAVYAWIVRPPDGLVLVPFLLAGWLISEAWWRWRGRRAAP